MRDPALLAAALAACTLGMGWLALAMESHWQQVRGTAAPPRAAPWRLRVLGASGITAALMLCLAADPAPIAALVWVMMLAASALGVAALLTWRPHWLRWLAAAAFC